MTNIKSNFRINQKGFTLVELIVVLVILVILAAILIPAMLGYIDRSKSTQCIMDAEYVMKAAEAEAISAYASGDIVLNKPASGNALSRSNGNYPSIKKISKLLDSDSYGNAGNDSWRATNVIYSGFGFNDSRNDSAKIDTKKHFIIHISERAQILGMTFCDGHSVVRYSPETGYDVDTAECSKTDQVFNYICIGDEGKSFYNTMTKDGSNFFSKNGK